MGRHEQPNALDDFVSHVPECGKLLFAVDLGRIIESPVDRLGARKERTILLCPIANRNNVVELLVKKLVQALGFLVSDVDSKFIHHLDRTRVQTFRIGSCTRNIVSVAGQLPQDGLGHLAACGIAGANKEDLLSCVHVFLTAHPRAP